MIKKLFFILLLVVGNYTYSQTIYNPTYIRSTASSDLKIEKIVIDGEHGTEVHFKFKNTTNKRFSIWMQDPGHPDALFLRETYKDHNGMVQQYRSRLRYFEGITSEKNETFIEPGQTASFMACFHQIDHRTFEFDIIEGDSGNWNFFNIKVE